MTSDTQGSEPAEQESRQIDVDGIVGRLAKVRQAMDNAGMSDKLSAASIAESDKILQHLDLSDLDQPK